MRAGRANLAPIGENLRKDAAENRSRLIEAAVKLYARHGSQVPLELIAEEAGVTRTTLHRNFPDRASLSAVVAEVQYDKLAKRVAKWADRDDGFFLALKVMAEGAVRSGGMSKVTQFRAEVGPLAAHFVARAEAILEAPLARAKTAGLVRADFTIDEAYRAVLMIAGGALQDAGENESEDTRIEKSLALLRRGMTP
jgi:AcrR family transcriptional regulator